MHHRVVPLVCYAVGRDCSLSNEVKNVILDDFSVSHGSNLSLAIAVLSLPEILILLAYKIVLTEHYIFTFEIELIVSIDNLYA